MVGWLVFQVFRSYSSVSPKLPQYVMHQHRAFAAKKGWVFFLKCDHTNKSDQAAAVKELMVDVLTKLVGEVR